MGDRRVHRVQLIFQKNLPVVVLYDAETTVDDLDVAVGGPVAHVVKSPPCIAEPRIKRRSRFRKTGKDKPTI